MRVYIREPEKVSGLINFCSWSRMVPLLREAAGAKYYEEVTAIFVDEAGIHIQLTDHSKLTVEVKE